MRALVSSSNRSICLSLAVCGLALLALAGCAENKGPTLGQRIAALGDSHTALANEWEQAEA